jgi:hypothetical protein
MVNPVIFHSRILRASNDEEDSEEPPEAPSLPDDPISSDGEDQLIIVLGRQTRIAKDRQILILDQTKPGHSGLNPTAGRKQMMPGLWGIFRTSLSVRSTNTRPEELELVDECW